MSFMWKTVCTVMILLLLNFFRYLVSDDRTLFMFKDGSQAWDAKDFLIEQERCKEVVLENKSYFGKHTEKVRR